MPERSIVRSKTRSPSDLFHSLDAAMQEIHDRVHGLVESAWQADDLWNRPLLQGLSLLPSEGGLSIEPFGHVAEDLKALKEGWRAPLVDYEVLDSEVVLDAELPGLQKEDIQLEVAPRFIRIEGARKSEAKKRDKDATHMEKTARRFRTVISPGAEMDPDRVSAQFENGVLEVRVARTDAGAQRTRLIELK